MEKLKPKFKTYPQMNRTFELNRMAIERCKADFPECYHFKHLQAKECEELAGRLKMGLALLVELKENGTAFTEGQNKHFKAFRNGARYLIGQLKKTAQHVADVEKGEFTPTPYSPFISTNEKDGTGESTEAELMLERIEQRQRTLDKQQARRGKNEPSNGD